jgi:hypothetical protein
LNIKYHQFGLLSDGVAASSPFQILRALARASILFQITHTSDTHSSTVILISLSLLCPLASLWGGRERTQVIVRMCVLGNGDGKKSRLNRRFLRPKTKIVQNLKKDYFETKNLIASLSTPIKIFGLKYLPLD